MTAQANLAALYSKPAEVPTVCAPRVAVSVGGLPEWRVSLDYVESEMGRAPRAVFSVGLGYSPLFVQDTRLEEAARHVAPGQLVRARLLRGGTIPGADRRDLVLFEGRVTQVELGLDAEGERLRFEAEDPASEVLRRRVGGQRIRTADGAVQRITGEDLVFNADGRPNAAAQLYAPQEGDPYTIFAPISPAGAVAWTLDEAVAHLLSEFAASDVLATPSRDEVLNLLDAAAIRDVDLEGLTLGEALQVLLELAGGQFLVMAEPGSYGVSRRLELWLPEKAQTVWLSHQATGQAYRPSGTHFQALGVTAHFGSAPRRYAARGDRKIHESTFDLVAGWDDSLASYELEDYSPSTNSGFDAVRDVFRKWVLNEAGEYSASPYDRGPAPDLSVLFEGAPYVRRHRRLLPCLSRDSLGRGYGVYAEMSLDGGSTRERLRIGAQVLAGECGLYLTEDVLPSWYLAAAVRGQVRVRVTAAIESDACLMAERVTEGAEDTPGTTRWLDAPAGYRYRKVAETSRFHGQSDADDVDDSARLQALVDAAFEADRRSPTPGRIEVPYLSLTHKVGRRLRGIRGRRIDLAKDRSEYKADPVVRRVRYRLAPTPATELELE